MNKGTGVLLALAGVLVVYVTLNGYWSKLGLALFYPNDLEVTT